MLFWANINVFSCPVSSNVNSEPRSSNGNGVVTDELTGDTVVGSGGSCVTDGRTVVAFDELAVVDGCTTGGKVTESRQSASKRGGNLNYSS